MKRMLCFLMGAAAFVTQAQNSKLTVHEWGTFTSLQDELGGTVSGINTDEEPLPDFVHDLNGVAGTVSQGKGAPLHYPDITMRLETPVIYFHPSSAQPLTVDVKVTFRGGWLTQFYPNALCSAPGAFFQLDARTTGKLTWSKLTVGGEANGPETSARVWTAPRAVSASSITATNGERERYVFYRGVGHLNAPLRVSRYGRELTIQGQLYSDVTDRLAIKKLWLVESRTDGAFACRALNALTVVADDQSILAKTPSSFGENEFSAGNLARLRKEMREAMIAEGLFTDEADALLNTWEVSYFKSAGLRLFFLVPRAWTDHYLPLELSTPAEVTRLMIGRIELVTPEQRRLARQIADAPVSKRPLPSLAQIRKSPGSDPIAASYLALGRFRNALIRDEQRRRPTESLRAFIDTNALDEWQP
jgi:hypothetical protein